VTAKSRPRDAARYYFPDREGSKLVGSGAVGLAQQGYSVALSADGNTAIVGGPDDDTNVGATWVFTRSGGIWTQQGSKLVGTGAVGIDAQGVSVALSADGNTAIVGGYQDNSNTGAAWVFTRSGGVWTQQSKLVGTGGGQSQQGYSVCVRLGRSSRIAGGRTHCRAASRKPLATTVSFVISRPKSCGISWR
jgi:hypothetical protein